MTQIKKNKFGESISFTEVFSHVVYIAERNLIHTKIYFNETPYTIVEGQYNEDTGNTRFPSALRKLIFNRQIGEGIIIGQTKRTEGTYLAESRQISECEYEAPYLTPTHTYTFWVVAIGLNKTVLVPK